MAWRFESSRPHQNFRWEFCSFPSSTCPTEPERSHMSKFTSVLPFILFCAVLTVSPASSAQSAPTPPEKVIIDTDIGDDIDDAFAVALALRSPELHILVVTTTFGDTETRAKLLDRSLAEVGRPHTPLAAGVPSPPKGTFTQRRYAE